MYNTGYYATGYYATPYYLGDGVVVEDPRTQGGGVPRRHQIVQKRTQKVKKDVDLMAITMLLAVFLDDE